MYNDHPAPMFLYGITYWGNKMAAPIAGVWASSRSKTNSRFFGFLCQSCCRNYSSKKSKKLTKRQGDLLDNLFPVPQTSTVSPKLRNKSGVTPSSTSTAPSPIPKKKDEHNSGVSNTSSHALKFKQVLQQRYREAQRSVIVRTQSPASTVQSLMTYGHLSSSFYTSQDKLYVLAEYANEQNVGRLQSSTSLFLDQHQFPMHSRCLYDVNNPRNPPARHSNQPMPTVREDLWHVDSMTHYPVMDTLDEELKALCARRSLNDLDLRIRFLVCVMVEEMLQSFLPGSRVIPYGSCLNGFGWWNSDLDMMLCLKKDPYSSNVVSAPVSSRKTNHNFRFITETFSTERQLAQRTLAMVASLVELMPRTSNVFKILNARVPIIRFRQTVFPLHCDISLEALDSIKMTELLYLMSSSDPRVRPLMAAIKQWAVGHKLTASGEQQKPTTIGLLAMLIYFLQTRSPAVLPTLKELRLLADFEDLFKIDSVLYGIPSQPSVIPKSKNTESMESLLHGFFAFYSQFDFSSQAISLIEGSTFAKPAGSSPVYVENPLCIGLNICQNVAEHQLMLFSEAMQEAARKVDGFSGQAPSDGRSRLDVLFSSGASSASPVSVSVSDLFDDVVAEKGGGGGEAEAAVDGNGEGSEGR
ncbi:poly(A) RNA polymerase, mitochondrial [Aplysia californica]|uniref:Poly(A) RNA polymerase, mitochondrial n=1 Tax=Aplysia californica TaxID=6500 RepID=A0ABM1A186_APLCA|nr:poly(A) RNA polymerase, mitochondrial [Aplysia californica]